MSRAFHMARLQEYRSGGLVATDEPWALAPAVLRPGRFDEKIYVGLPDLEARVRILQIHLTGQVEGAG